MTISCRSLCTDMGRQKEMYHFVEDGRETLGRFGSKLASMANCFGVDALWTICLRKWHFEGA